MKFCLQKSLLTAVALVVLFGAAQSRAQEAKGGAAVQAHAALAASTEELKASTSELIRIEEDKVATLSAKLEQLRQLFSEGIVAKVEVENAERAMLESNSRLEDLRKQLAESGRLLAEAEAADKRAREQAAKTAALAARIHSTNRYSTGASMIRYTGKTGSVFANLAGVQSFFASTFGRPLPISAFGQSATHDRFGYDHSNAVDVPLHPDSAEGRALIGYLQSRGIAFLAFRSAIPGVATGPHIHIGRPSSRIG
jgi:hypothetical protein